MHHSLQYMYHNKEMYTHSCRRATAEKQVRQSHADDTALPLVLTSDATPTRAPLLAARYTRGRRSLRASSPAALKRASSRGPNAPDWWVMSLAIAITCDSDHNPAK